MTPVVLSRRNLLAASLELSLGEGGLEQDLGQEVETQLEILLEHGKCDRRAVPPGVAFEAAADELYGAVELGPGALGGAARQQVGGQVGEPSRVGRIGPSSTRYSEISRTLATNRSAAS